MKLTNVKVAGICTMFVCTVCVCMCVCAHIPVYVGLCACVLCSKPNKWLPHYLQVSHLRQPLYNISSLPPGHPVQGYMITYRSITCHILKQCLTLTTLHMTHNHSLHWLRSSIPQEHIGQT